MLAALAYWGFTVGDGAGAWVLGVGAPLLAAVVWARQWAWLTIHLRLLAVARTATAESVAQACGSADARVR